jgi:Ca-activated chloride channel family protein
VLEDFHFLRPWWLAALVPLCVLAWFWVRRTQASSKWETTISSELLDVLIDRSTNTSSRWLTATLLICALLAPVGLAGPTWERLPQEVEQRNDALIVLLDLSLSMLAEDVEPSRIARARQKITDILRTRDEGLTALVAYAGDAHAVVPLTDDSATIENLLFSLSPEMMPVYGSNPNHALQIAEELFENALLQQGRILIITDGIDAPGTVTQYRRPSFPISVLGVGTTSGAGIPLDRLRQPGRFLETEEGTRIIANLNEDRLEEVADASYGKYSTLTLGDRDIEYVLSTRLPGEDETIEVEREFDTWLDQGHWFALLLIPFALYAFRRGVLVSIVVVCFVPVEQAHAAGIGDAWDALWQRDDQRGRDALRTGEPERAALLFDDPQWQSVARYKSGDYQGALSGFSADASITGLYNQGNSLARLGEYELAIAQYDQVLQADPDHEDAAFNKELIEQLLEEQQASDQQNQDQQSESDENNQSDETQDSQQQEQNPDEQQAQDQQQNQQESEEDQEESEGNQESEAEEDESSRDEKQEALEQWLRRVPDDPGGLLRRKFQHETKQRLRRGDYENRQGDKLW